MAVGWPIKAADAADVAAADAVAVAADADAAEEIHLTP